MMPMFLIEVRGEIQPRVYDKSEAAAYVAGMKRRSIHPEVECRLLPVVSMTVDMGKGELRTIDLKTEGGGA